MNERNSFKAYLDSFTLFFLRVCILTIMVLTQRMSITNLNPLIFGIFLFVPCLSKAEINFDSREKRFKEFENSLSGARFSGHFTVDGSDRPPSKESYELESVKKFGSEDLWIFTARIRYGNQDVTLPMPLPVKWVGSIPVITIHNLSIPGLGTFSAHVVIDGKKYAGTWSHGKVGGHLYGTISKFKEIPSQ